MLFHDFAAEQFLKAQALQLGEPQGPEQVIFLEVIKYKTLM